MIHITADKFKTVPWKNGKGTTEEIIRSSDDDRYDWRFSRADVSVDCPFSIFLGKSRILTVIQGAGISLITNKYSIQAAPFTPVSFSGEIPVQGQLWDGPIKDLNLIYSTERVITTAEIIKGSKRLKLEPSSSCFYAIYCLEGKIKHDSETIINPSDFAVFNGKPCSIALDEQSRILFYTLKLLS